MNSLALYFQNWQKDKQMKLLRHILSHLILISFLFAIVSLYYYRYQIIPDTYIETMNAYTDKIHPSVKLFSHNTKSTEIENEAIATEKERPVFNEAENNTITTDKVEQDLAVVNIPEDESKDSTLSDVMPDDSLVPNDELVNVKNPSEEVEPDSLSLGTDTETVVAVTASVEHTIDVSNVEVTDRGSDNTQDLLRAARLAFNQGNIDSSIKKYKDLIELDNDEADFHGELGNVYYAKGDWANAGIEYYAAASRLIEKKKFAQVAYLQRVIQGLDAERAEKLASELGR